MILCCDETSEMAFGTVARTMSYENSCVHQCEPSFYRMRHCGELNALVCFASVVKRKNAPSPVSSDRYVVLRPPSGHRILVLLPPPPHITLHLRSCFHPWIGKRSRRLITDPFNTNKDKGIFEGLRGVTGRFWQWRWGGRGGRTVSEVTFGRGEGNWKPF